MEDCKTENLLVGHCNSYWVAHHWSERVHVWWRVGSKLHGGYVRGGVTFGLCHIA
jgi:hypothetical protein